MRDPVRAWVTGTDPDIVHASGKRLLLFADWLRRGGAYRLGHARAAYERHRPEETVLYRAMQRTV
jgi:hypothetical protein